MLRSLKIWIFTGLVVAPLHLAAQLYINEFQASNINTILDYDGNYLQWVEIYNAGSRTVDLQGYYLSDSLDYPDRCKIKDHVVIPSGGYGLVWMDDPIWVSCEFSLDMDGEELVLMNPSMEILDYVNFPRQLVDVSYGRLGDGNSEWGYFEKASPEAGNGNSGLPEARVTDTVTFSLKGGLYSSGQLLELSVPSSQASIRYTLDGSWPGQESPLYSAPLTISENTVVRARAYETDHLHSSVITQSYIFNEPTLLPVVSISTDADNLFDDRIGIYVVGTNGTYGVCYDDPANWNKNWERPANFEYFVPGGEQVINQLVGTKIVGACSRSKDYKPMTINARKEYGDKTLDFRFFQDKPIDEFTRVILRNSGNDAYKSMFRDGFMQSLVAGKMDLDYQSYQPVIVYINGEFWGMLNLREKVNEHFVTSNYDIEKDDVDMLEKNLWTAYGMSINGTGETYEEMIDYIKANDLSREEHFQWVAERADVDEFMNYYLAEIYFQNEDWPQNNIKYWRYHQEGGKWRWVLFDTDAGWGMNPVTGNALEWATRGSSADVLIRGLLENHWFKSEFIQRMGTFASTIFHPEVVTPVFDSIKQMVDPEIIRQRQRWGDPTVERYNLSVEEVMPEFTQSHPDVIRQHIMSKFGISGTFELECSISGEGRGKVKAAGAWLPDSFTGPFFDGVDLRLEAIPESGYRFSHWEGASTSNTSMITLNTSSNKEIRAVFTIAEPVPGICINELSASNLTGPVDEYNQPEDWVEIYNGNAFEVDLGGWLIGDSLDAGLMYRIPRGVPEQTTIAADDYLLLWCDKLLLQGALHTSFRLDRGGEGVYLAQMIGERLSVVDSLRFGKQFTDISFGRNPEGADWNYMTPTPLARNMLGEQKGLILNEFASSGEVDWIELYNPTEESIELGGLFLTDSLGDPVKHQIPSGDPSTLLAPGAYVVLWADNREDLGPLHLSFRLSGKQEQLGLYQLGAGYLDSLSYKKNFSEEVLGRLPDGAGAFKLVSATPGATNRVNFLEDLYINEYMASNQSTLADEFGEYDDWIELYNAGDNAVDIGGLYISDTLGKRMRYRIPSHEPDSTTIAPGGHILLWADSQEEQGVLHLDFRLGAEGEELLLVQADGFTLIDSLSYRNAIGDQAEGRLEDGGANVQLLSASPGESNRVDNPGELYINEYMAANKHTLADEYGEFDDWIELYNAGDNAMDIGGLYISDTMGNRMRYRIPSHQPDSTTIAAGGYLILWADGQEGQGVLHLGFRLGSEGEELSIVQADGSTLIDSLSYKDAIGDQAEGRLDDGGANVQLLSASPGESNRVDRRVGLYINEFMASNRSTLADEYGQFDDWIEIFNAGENAVDIGGLYISDTLGNRMRHRIPSHVPDSTTIEAGGYLVLWADGEESQGVRHLDFRLSAGGEEILLTQADGMELIDSLCYTLAGSDQARGRLDDGSDKVQMLSATPGQRNRVNRVDSLYINEFMASNGSTVRDEYGEYDDWIEIRNGGNLPVDVGGLYISDSLGNPAMYRIPSFAPDSTTIPPGGYLLLWADGQTEQGVRHLDFRLSGSGEDIILIQADGKEIIDSLSYGSVYPNMALGYLDGQEGMIILSASPGFANYLSKTEKIYISELVASGNSSISDEYGEFDDWIELYNDNHFPVDVGGLYLSDSLADPLHSRIRAGNPDSTTIPPGGHMVFWADNQPGQGVRHLNFRLRGDGEAFVISGPNGELIIDSLSFPDQHKNFSYSRLNSTGEWLFLPPTFESRNILPDIRGIRINEIMTSNSFFENEHGQFTDWIELYNSNDQPFDVGGLYLTDSIGEPDKYRIPSHSPWITTIEAGGFLLLYADNKEVEGVLHTSFRLGREGEQLGLIHYDGSTIIDSLSYGEQHKNASSGLLEEGGSWYVLPPTPGQENQVRSYDGVVINEVMGFNRTIWGDENREYDDWIEIYNGGNDKVDIGGLFLSDSTGMCDRYRISSMYPDSTSIPPGGHLLIWADGDEQQGVLHSGMRINKTGELVLLYNFDGTLIDSISYPFISPNKSWGRRWDGDSRWGVFDTPTPLKANGVALKMENLASREGLHIYPNPVKDHLHVCPNQPADRSLLLRVCDMHGRILISMKMEPGQQEALIHADKLELGYYIIQVLSGNQVLEQLPFTRME